MNFFSPKQTAENYIKIGKTKINTPVGKTIILGIMAGVFIALAGIGSTTVSVSIKQESLAKLAGACIFPAGLTMVLLAGSELFTGNCLLTIPLLKKEIKITQMLKNWGIVYLGNFIGALLVALAVVYSHEPSLFGNAEAVSIITTAASKVSMSFSDVFIKGILCNFLVCIAVWISFAAKDIVGKIAGLFFPVMLFVLCGFEHSIANMYFISAGLFAKNIPEYAETAVNAGIDMTNLTWSTFWTHNIIPATLGNIVGGAICVGIAYYFIYLHDKVPKP